jgi:polyferredoxin/formate hydrogenlyase subunit 6/NADH:ubiquinone oxidoreductase subunit I
MPEVRMKGPLRIRNAWSGLRLARQVVQIACFLFAFVLFFSAARGRPLLPWADIFFRLDPLSGLAGMVAARAWIPRLAWGLVILGLTLLLGRVWCGWICPLGSLLEWVRLPGARKRGANVSPRWRQAKYLLLGATLISALFGSLSLLVLDPLAIFTRSFGGLFLVALDRVVTALEGLIYPLPFLSPLVDWLENLLRGPILPAEARFIAGSGWIFLLLAGILGLNALAERFWCRYLCPLGGLLGLLARFSFLRPVVGSGCTACGKCSRVCAMGAIAAGKPYEVAPSECVMCLDCLADCPREDMGIQPGLPPLASPGEPLVAPLPGRRAVLYALAAGTAGVLVAESGLGTRQPDPFLVRPPGAQDETAFLSRCLRCSECIRVCPTGGLQPALLQSGLEGLWTPHLVSRLGACDYACTTCGETCPSGAIPLLELAQKREVIIGLASIDQNRCLPWAYNMPCIVCEEMCPRPEKAVQLDTVVVKDSNGLEKTLQRPYVVRERCIGCGICENQCPVASTAAIRVINLQRMG